MARTVDSQEKSRLKRIHYGLFMLGVGLLCAGIVLFIPALQYEFTQGTSDSIPEPRVIKYELLTPQEQRVVDGALDGKTYRLETSGPLPGSAPVLEPETMQVSKRGTTHLFTSRAVFPAKEPKGMATIALVVGGLLVMVEAVRRHHFPKSLPWQTS